MALLKRRTTLHPRRCQRDEGSFADYVKAIRDTYVSLPTTARRLQRNELKLVQHLYAQQVPSLHVEAALLVETARRVLRHEPHPKKPIRSLHQVVPLLEQVRRSAVSEGYVHYLRHKLRHVLQAKAPPG